MGYLAQKKMEWDATKAIALLHGRQVGGNRISVQKVKYVNRSTAGGSNVQIWRNNNRRRVLLDDGQRKSVNLQKVCPDR